MPMNEYRRSDPRVLTSATALFESGVGRGSNLGSGTANRSATREKRKIKARNLFIAEDSTWHGALALEPGLCFVFAVGFAELGFENLGLFICAENLNRNQNEQKQQCVWPFQRDYDSGQHQAAENINRVANFRVKSVRDKLAGLRRHRTTCPTAIGPQRAAPQRAEPSSRRHTAPDSAAPGPTQSP